MDGLVASLRRQRAAAALVPLFFVSGATGLVYQTLWARQLHLLVGTSTFAVATVLAAFMAGLALGGAALARTARRIAQPLRVYGLLEVGIGVYAALFPALLGPVGAAWLWLARDVTLGPVGFGVAQLLIVGALLLPPTAAMGATLPLLARFTTEQLGAVGDRVGLLYAVNTVGAVAGTWLAGFVLLPGLGLSTTTLLAAGANVALGAVALAVARGAPPLEGGAVVGEVTVAAPRALHAAALSSGLAGLAAMIYEVAWFRLLGLLLGASAYAFSTMLLAFLVGIALGGRLGGPAADRRLARAGREGVLRTLALVQLGVALVSLLMMHVWQELPFWYVWLFDGLQAGRHPRAAWAVSLLLAGLVMTPPAVLMGAAFPLAVRAAVARDDVGGAVGRIYTANTCGGVVGAAAAGFLLLPWLGVQGTVLLAAAVNVLAALAAWAGQPGGGRAALRRASGLALGAGVAVLVGGVALRPGWDPMLMTAGMYKYVTSFSDHSREGIRDYAVERYELLYYREGLSSVVTVARNRDSGNIWLANNGKVDASTTFDMPTQVLVALLPLQFVDDPADVLVIGLASGITAGAAGLHEGVERLEVVELEPAIEEAARFFAPWNHDLLDDPRTRLVVADGRNHLLRARPGTWDVVVSEPSNPWLTGVSNLFTREFFELGRSRLAPGGVWAQWVQLYGMDDRDLRSLVASFTDVFPHVLLYAAAEDADLVLVGSERPLLPSAELAERLLARPAIAAELAQVDITGPEDLVGALLMDRDGLVAMAGDVERNTDDNMRIEYAAPLHLHRDTQGANAALLARHAQLPERYLGDAPERWSRLARGYRDREDPRAVDALVRAGLLLPPDDPRRAAWVEEAFAWFVEDERGEGVTPTLRAALEGRFLEERVEPMLRRP